MNADGVFGLRIPTPTPTPTTRPMRRRRKSTSTPAALTYPRLDVFVHWVTKQTPYNAFKSHFVTYGNEPSLSHDYGRVCLIVNVGPPGRRADKPLPI